MTSSSEQRQLWKVFSAAIGAELRDDTVIQGVSGLKHAVQAIAVDDRSNRVIIVSAEANPRMAALMQVDVQAAFPSARVLVARPVIIDVNTLVRAVFSPHNISEIDIRSAKKFLEDVKKMPNEEAQAFIRPEAQSVFDNTKRVYERMELPTVTQVLDVVSQAESLPWAEIMAIFEEEPKEGIIDLRPLLTTNSLHADLGAGVCPIPLYEFSESDFDVFTTERRIEDARERLKNLGIHQYFYPPADQMTLGLIDRGLVRGDKVALAAAQAPALGHPLGDSELVTSSERLVDVVEKLGQLGYVAEGEHGLEVSEKGRSIRSTVKFRPREGLVTKLLNRFSFSATITPKDFL